MTSYFDSAEREETATELERVGGCLLLLGSGTTVSWFVSSWVRCAAAGVGEWGGVGCPPSIVCANVCAPFPCFSVLSARKKPTWPLWRCIVRVAGVFFGRDVAPFNLRQGLLPRRVE